MFHIRIWFSVGSHTYTHRHSSLRWIRIPSITRHINSCMFSVATSVECTEKTASVTINAACSTSYIEIDFDWEQPWTYTRFWKLHNSAWLQPISRVSKISNWNRNRSTCGPMICDVRNRVSCREEHIHVAMVKKQWTWSSEECLWEHEPLYFLRIHRFWLCDARPSLWPENRSQILSHEISSEHFSLSATPAEALCHLGRSPRRKSLLRLSTTYTGSDKDIRCQNVTNCVPFINY